MNEPIVHIAIPAMNEYNYIFNTIKSISKNSNFKLYILINQPEKYWNDNRIDICLNNQKTYEEIRKKFPWVIVLDKFSKGKGWEKGGVGEARSYLFDYILKNCSKNDIIASLDADTTVEENYCSEIIKGLKNSKISAISIPYYHRLTKDTILNKKLLYYEIYMRTYSINLSRIGSIYNFTALGSAIAVKPEKYKKVGGYLKREAGEDYYLLQSLVKNFKISNYINTIVYPSTRESKRVPFGTGPAISFSFEKLIENYPIFNPKLFDDIKEFYNNVHSFLDGKSSNRFSTFILSNRKNVTAISKIRENFKNEPLFKRGVERYIDGVKILQFLKYFNNNSLENLNNLYKLLNIDFELKSVENESQLEKARKILTKIDLRLKKI
ncbi:MAG: hypothetical protein CR982_05370 [Candidatus Cloacimonadota bacterium]|nr:MAG: hypothetical protein CR982_05370 [Candidatus Cloacimonadota bacterium]PIE77991.1 MAG: hypothetical protein CSA15_10040 [Candidatus Delongbacteria bacterium]